MSSLGMRRPLSVGAAWWVGGYPNKMLGGCLGAEVEALQVRIAEFEYEADRRESD